MYIQSNVCPLTVMFSFINSVLCLSLNVNNLMFTLHILSHCRKLIKTPLYCMLCDCIKTITAYLFVPYQTHEFGVN